MTLLVISPDYASHLLPLATLATAWRDAGERVVVATGPATDPDRARVRSRALRPAARSRQQRARDPRRGAARRRVRLAEGLLRRDPARHGADAAVPGERAPHRPDVGPGGCRPTRPRRRREPCSPTRSSWTISRSAHVSHCRPPASPTPTSCSGTRARCRSRARSTATRRSGRLRSRPSRRSSPTCERSATRSRRASRRSGTAPPAPSSPRHRSPMTRSASTATSCSTTTRPPSRKVTDAHCRRTPSSAPPAGSRRSTTRSKRGWRPRPSSRT